MYKKNKKTIQKIQRRQIFYFKKEDKSKLLGIPSKIKNKSSTEV